MEFPAGDIEERACRISRSFKKEVEFQWVLVFGLGISKRCNKILWDF